MASVLLRAICGRPQSSRMAIPHSASEGNTDFFAVLLVSLPQITQISTDADSHRLRKICVYLPHQRYDLRFDQASRMASAICGRPQASRMAILHSTFEGPIPHYKTTRLFAEAYTPNLRKSPLFRFPQSLLCFLLQDNQRHFFLPHDIAPRLQSLSNLRHKN